MKQNTPKLTRRITAKTISLLLLSSVTAFPAMAKTVVYGELHGSFSSRFPIGSGSDQNLRLNNSFVGVKGAHEIAENVSLIYQFAWGLSANNFDGRNKNGNTTLNNRNQAVGVASQSGAVIVGRFDTPFKTVGRKADLFWHSQLGQNRNITHAHTWDLRADKIIIVQSPRKKGFQTSIAYASDIADTSRLTDNASAVSLNAFYQKDNILFGVGYERHNLEQRDANRDAIRLSARYKKEALNLVGFYQKENNAFAETNVPDAQVFGAGAAYQLGAGVLKAQYYVRDNDGSAKNQTLLALGYDYKLSKRLGVYAQTARMSRGSTLGDFSANANSADHRGIAVGVRYAF